MPRVTEMIDRLSRVLDQFELDLFRMGASAALADLRRSCSAVLDTETRQELGLTRLLGFML